MRRAAAITAWFLGTMCLAAHTSWAADGLRLTLARGPGPGELSLEWDGGGGPFAVSRAGAADLVDDPGAHLGNTGASSWLDTGVSPLLFYRVVETTCGNGQIDFGEECDDGAHSGGDGCSGRCTREAATQCGHPGPWPPPAPQAGSLMLDTALFFKLDESGEDPRTDAVIGHEVLPDPSGAGTIAVPAKAGGLGQHLDGPNRYHFWSPTASVLDHGGGSFTWSGWARIDSRYDDQAIVGKWSIPEQQREYLLRYNATTGLYEFEVSSNGGGSTCEVGHVAHPTIVETGRFYFVEGWHDAGAGSIGVRVSTERLRGQPASIPWTVGVHFGWGDLNIGAHNTCLDDHFHGTLDAVGFWKRTLSEEESILLWNHGDGLEYPF